MSQPSTEVDWGSIRIGVVGGDARDPEIARAAAETGAAVRAYGIPWPEDGLPGVERAGSPQEAVKGADYIFFPIPVGVGLDVYAPHVEETIVADEELFSQAAEGAYMFCGRVTPEIRAAADAAGVRVHEYDYDTELMLLRGPAIVEGALQQAIANTDVTINQAEVVVVGFGTIGRLLARTLHRLGARVHVAARNPIQRAGAYADGLLPLTLVELPELAPSLDMVFSTVPARVVDRKILELLPKGTLVLDIAPPPDHADLDAAAELGHRAVWARGLGRRAPVTVGRSQWTGLRRYITEIERSKREGGTWDG
ncbi:MAG TPA: dipicolinate synthase subunit DpsA [Actinomycetota bacterium]|nr:dipicolinate synthase subunit DpsA [Actinomycetota bacterium]